MSHAASASLLKELNRKHRKGRFAPVAVLASIGALVWAIFHPVAPFFVAVIAVYCVVGIASAGWLDRLRKTTRLVYDFEPEAEPMFERLFSAAVALARCSKSWHIAAAATVHDRKYHAGASSVVRRNRTSVRIADPPFLRTNVKTVAISAGKQTLYFFPDRLLVFERGRIGAIGYDDLVVSASSTQFVESPPPPPDALIVDYTWQFPNKDGGRDLRFNNNARLPVCRYSEVHFSSSSSLNEIVQFSKADVGADFEAALEGLRGVRGVPSDSDASGSASARGSNLASLFCTAGALAAFALIGATIFDVAKRTAPEVDRSGFASRVALERTTPKAGSRFRDESEAQREAVRLFPQLAVAGSKENLEFLARYKEYRSTRPEFFKSTDWPVELAREVCLRLPSK